MGRRQPLVQRAHVARTAVVDIVKNQRVANGAPETETGFRKNRLAALVVVIQVDQRVLLHHPLQFRLDAPH